MKLLLVLAATLLAASPAQASPGDLDPTFSGDGKELTSIAASAYGADVALQADGGIVVAGGSYAGVGGTHHFALARYLPDGSLDPSFDGDGRLTTDFGGGAAYGLALQPDGKIVAAGYGAEGFALARYLPDGSLDPSFDGDGRLTDFAGGNAYGLALQGDGKIVVVGRVPGFGEEGDFALARYTTDGMLDGSFSGDGRQTTDLGGEESLSQVTLQTDGKLVAVGSTYTFTGSSTAFVVARYDGDGSLDPSFGTLFQGMQLTGVSGTDAAADVAVQPDGRILAAGGTIDDFLLARYNPDGSPDATFSGDGTQETDFGGSDGAGGVALQPDGRIVAAGTSYTYGADGAAVGSFAVARYQSGSDAGMAPANTTPPTISGTATEGRTLTVSPGAWSGSAPLTLRDQWRRCDATSCVDIDGATSSTHLLTGADVGHTIRVRQTATNAYGTSSVESAATAVVRSRPGAIRGTVRRDRTGAPIASAAVSCGSGYSARTATDGTYFIADVAAGSYSCSATAKHYAPSTQSVTVESGEIKLADFTLARR